jgi:2-deoxy-D-gluconate 3-dehydrogenase
MILDDFKLNGKVAIVTGAGRTAKLVKALGRRVCQIKADLQDRASVPRIVDTTVTELGGVDILVNNAGIIRRGPMLEFAEKDWDDVLQVNQSAVFFLSQAAARQMVAQGRGGRIIHIASVLSFQGGIRVPSYTAAKHALMGLTRIMANELAAQRITVNAIAPGYMVTDNTAALRADAQRNSEILSRIPVGRWGEPEDLKGAVVFLASPASAYMTGHTLAVDGGWLAR